MNQLEKDVMLNLCQSTSVSIMYLTNCISATMVRERYTPYVTLDCKFAYTSDFDCSKVYMVCFMYGATEIFRGKPDKLECTMKNGIKICTVSASSYTMMLELNEATPGMMTSCGISEIIAANPTIPQVTYQNITTKANYIYVKDGSNMWDAICGLDIKLYNLYPFVKGLNNVALTPGATTTWDLSEYDITEVFSGEDTSKMLSKIYMKGTGDTYDYSATCTEATTRSIVREKYIDLDRQWLSSAARGLQYKLNYAMRGCNYDGFTYRGFNNEQMLEPCLYSSGGITIAQKKISKVVLNINLKGVFTTLYRYTDGFCT